MPHLVELSHPLADAMAGINPAYSVRVRTYLSHEETAPRYGGHCSFEVSEVAFQVPVGTYIDSPRTLDPGGRDIGAIGIEELVLPGVVLDMHGRRPDQPVAAAELPGPDALAGHAVLLDFGWAERYGRDDYDPAPYLSRAAVEHLVAARAALLGVDVRSPDGPDDPTMPAHSLLLSNGIFIVENLCGLAPLHGRAFRFFAIPLAVKDATSFPVRAFAELQPA